MKVEGKQIRFLMPTAWFTRSRLLFAGSRHSLQLLETALIIEGYLMRLFFPVVDRFFRQALSEWTTITVPYSRILRFKHRPMTLPRVIVTVLLWLPVLLALIGAVLSPPANDGGAGLLVFLILALLILLLTLVCNLWLLAPRSYLWFRQGDGGRALVVFRIRSRKRQKAFVELLRANCRTARERGLPQATETADERVSAVPWVLLAVYLAGHYLVAPLYQRWETANSFGGRPGDIVVGMTGWLWLTVLLGLPLLPALMLALLPVARRSPALRYWAGASLLLVGLVPLVQWALVGSAPYSLFRLDVPGTFGGIVSMLFHGLLAIVLVLATSPEKEDWP